MDYFIAEEKFTFIRDEYRDLVYGYWYATPENKDHVPVDYDWEQYNALDSIGALKLYTARNKADALIGVALYVVVSATHHKGYKVADCDTLATGLHYRGLGIGKALTEYAKTALPLLGVKEIVHRSRHVFGTDKSLFPSLGFTPIETVYSLKV